MTSSIGYIHSITTYGGCLENANWWEDMAGRSYAMVLIIEAYQCYQLHTKFQLSVTAYTGEIIENYQHGFQCNKSITNQICCIHQIILEKWEYDGMVCQLLLKEPQRFS